MQFSSMCLDNLVSRDRVLRLQDSHHTRVLYVTYRMWRTRTSVVSKASYGVTSSYHPQTDGHVEMFNKMLKVMLRKSSVDGLG